LTAYLLLLALAGIVIAVIAGGPVLRRRRRSRLVAQPAPASWRPILDTYVPAARHMPEALRQRWLAAIKVFLAEKRFVGCDGLEVTEEMRVAIAGQACLMALERTHAFDDVRWILVYPTAFHVTRHEVDEAGVETVERTLLSGESWEDGRVIISWDDVWYAARAGERENVVLHEFAHQLDEGAGSAGAPVLQGHGNYEAWAAVIGDEYRSLQERSARGDPGVLDDYGATDPSEFFAVATEAFFETPVDMRAEHAGLYAQLREYYGVDPASWLDDAAQPGAADGVSGRPASPRS
jgi:Mlc titration factor MtfA (ptsG expression regulator)